MTNTDEAFKRYCETHGPCNRVVFDNAFDMGRESMVKQRDGLIRLLEQLSGVLSAAHKAALYSAEQNQ